MADIKLPPEWSGAALLKSDDSGVCLDVTADVDKIRTALRQSALTVARLQERAHIMARAKGFWGDAVTPITDTFEQHLESTQARYEQALVVEKLALLHSEVTEALEEVRSGSREGFAEELADVIIRTADLAEALGINLTDTVQAKLEKNTTRPPMHGKRF